MMFNIFKKKKHRKLAGGEHPPIHLYPGDTLRLIYREGNNVTELLNYEFDKESVINYSALYELDKDNDFDVKSGYVTVMGEV